MANLSDYADRYNEVEQKESFSSWLKTELEVDGENPTISEIRGAIINNAEETGYSNFEFAKQDAEELLGNISSHKVVSQEIIKGVCFFDYWEFRSTSGKKFRILIDE